MTKEKEEDDFVCPDCGGDLADLGDDLYECVSCGEVYDAFIENVFTFERGT